MASRRSQQPHTGGVGKVFVSPIKRRAKKKTTTIAKHLGQDKKISELRKKLEILQNSRFKTPERDLDRFEVEETPPFIDEQVQCQEDVPMEIDPTPNLLCNSPTKPRRELLPNGDARKLFDRWKSVLPLLVAPLLSYVSSTVGEKWIVVKGVKSQCRSPRDCHIQTKEVLCLFVSHFETFNVVACDCQDILQTLVVNGLFPASPSQPRLALSIELLDLYRALFERSCDAVNALASALHTHYARRGFHYRNSKGEVVKDPFRRGIGNAVQWYDNLQGQLNNIVDQALQATDKTIAAIKLAQQSAIPTSTHLSPSSDVQSQPPPQLSHQSPSFRVQSQPSSVSQSNYPSPSSGVQLEDTSPATAPKPREDTAPVIAPKPRTECDRLLQQRCPACFAGISFGRVDDVADFIVSTDGNFSQRHLAVAGDCPKFYDPLYFLPKEFVDRVGARIDTARPKRQRRRPVAVPDDAVDQCESGHVAGKGTNVKSNAEHFDDGGVMALICRHDIPLFLANIDTPGEQQKYPVALIEHLFTLVPDHSTVAVLYDVACVLDRSLEKFDILSNNILDRLTFGTTAMHAYGHQWACQLVYNPRIREGLGLSDGEGTERLWSKLRKLISITRQMARSRRIWMLDRQTISIGAEMRDDLGNWIVKRKRHIEKQEQQALKILEDCGVSMSELAKLWKEQKAAQLSLRAHAPVRLKKELDTVLSLQGDLDTVDSAIDALGAAGKNAVSKESLLELRETQEKLKDKVEELYASLNVHDAFPELVDVDLEFVRTLLMARDLKINIRKRAIGSFFEWDKLDQATKGRHQPLGTKLHQHTMKAIKKRQPALQTAIRKFNRYCTRLAELHKPEWGIPLPATLPTTLDELRGNGSTILMEDVWITRTPGALPRWLEDTNVREGIRAMLKVARCREERVRIGAEADNLCRWFGRELSAVESALALPSNDRIRILLLQHRTRITSLKTQWSNPMATAIRFDAHLQTALDTALRVMKISGVDAPRPPPSPVTWLEPIVTELNDLDDDPDSDPGEPEPTYSGDHVMDSMGTMLDDFLEEDDGHSSGKTPSALITLSESTPALNMKWESPIGISPDYGLLQALRFQTFAPPPIHHNRRTVPQRGGSQRFQFDPPDIDRLRSSKAMLNDVCINSTAALLQQLWMRPGDISEQHSLRCAVFSTFDLIMVRYNCSPQEIYRRTAKIQYWNRDIWILPIHRTVPAAHWVMCVIYTRSQEILFFDSLADKSLWQREMQEIMSLVRNLVLGANLNGHRLHIITEEGWTAKPVITSALQSGPVSCGLWVVAGIAAVLRGYHFTGLTEEDMDSLRSSLYRHVLYLPSAV